MSAIEPSRRRREPERRDRTHRARVVLLALVAAVLATSAQAGPREQARRLHDRIAGVPPDPTTLDAMETQIAGGDALGAAFVAMDHPAFYRTSLKNFVTPWTNVEQHGLRADLNDYTATVIGIDPRRPSPSTDVLTADRRLRGRARRGRRRLLAQRQRSTTRQIEEPARSTCRTTPRCCVPVGPSRRLQRCADRHPNDAAGDGHHPRGRRGLLQRRNQPAHVALHLDELSCAATSRT